MGSRENADVWLSYCARELDAEQAALLERHIQGCAECREFARGQQSVWQALDAWEAMPVSSDFDRRLYERIDAEVSWFDRLVRPLRPVLSSLGGARGLPIAAAAGLVITAGLLLERPGQPPVPSGSAVVETVPADQVENALDDMELLHQFNSQVRADSARM